MRTLDSARRSFEELQKFHSLQELKEAIRLKESTSIATEGCRSACWKAFLVFETLDVSTWTRTLSASRSAYNSLRAHFLRYLENPDEGEPDYDPLSSEADASQSIQLRKDEELRVEILQDVTRCMPDNLYFRQPDTQRILLDILFVFCKLNPDVSYRQGMHELLAPILWVVERDAIDLGHSSKTMGEDALVATIFDSNHIEHDTFAIFGQVMQSAKKFYEQTTTSGQENPIVSRSQRIFQVLLPRVDEQLAKHLDSIEVVPQVFLMRWIRLLFGREFAFDEMLTMWDAIFAQDPTLEIVNEICLTMLLKIRWQLLEADYNSALTLLLKYPEIEKDFSAQTFVIHAAYLRDHMDYHGGSFLVEKYTGRPLYQTGRPVTPPALQRNHTTFSGTNVTSRNSKLTKPQVSYASTSPRDLNKAIQSTAKEWYARGERLGIGKAVRNAVDEVQKRAQEIRDAQTPSAPPMHRRGGSRSSLGPDPLLKQIQTLEDRNKGLAKLLDGAISELWAYHKSASEPARSHEIGQVASLENLSAAIAKAQFVQVYLADPSLRLSTNQDDNETVPMRNGPVTVQASGNSSSADNLIRSGRMVNKPVIDDVAAVENDTNPSSQAASENAPDISSDISPKEPTAIPVIGSANNRESTAEEDGALARNNAISRPRLEQSSFSWMLGTPADDSTSTATRAPSFAAERARSKGFLFGNDAG